MPESERWQQQGRAASSNWAIRDLWGVAIGALAALSIIYLATQSDLPFLLRVVGTIVSVVVAAAGYLYPVIRYVARSESGVPGTGLSISKTVRRMLLAAGLSGVALLGTWASMQWAPTWADKLTGGNLPEAKGWTQVAMAAGAILGTILARWPAIGSAARWPTC